MINSVSSIGKPTYSQVTVCTVLTRVAKNIYLFQIACDSGRYSTEREEQYAEGCYSAVITYTAGLLSVLIYSFL